MSNAELLSHCPLCGGLQFHPFKSIKDHAVSGEIFPIVICKSCGLHFTNPRPSAKDISEYYDSEDYISHTNQGNSVINKLYKLARVFTLRWKYKTISKKGIGKLLDFGCGTGSFAGYCANYDWMVTGLEPNQNAREIAEKEEGLSIVDNLSLLSGNRFDVITLWHVLEHLPDLTGIMEKLVALLDDNGEMFLAVPNYKAYDAGYFSDYWAAYDVPRHLYHFDRDTMTYLVQKHGMMIEAIIPMKLDAYYVSLLSNKYKQGNNRLLNSFITASLSNIYANKSNEYSSLIYKVTKSG